LTRFMLWVGGTDVGAEETGDVMVFIGESATLGWQADKAPDTHQSQVVSRMPRVCDRLHLAGSDHY
jgi:hypothetical protein